MDDIILIASSDLLRQSIMSKLSSEFAMKDLGPLSSFLGIVVSPTPAGLFLCQKNMLLKFWIKQPCLNVNLLLRLLLHPTNFVLMLGLHMIILPCIVT